MNINISYLYIELVYRTYDFLVTNLLTFYALSGKPTVNYITIQFRNISFCRIYEDM